MQSVAVVILVMGARGSYSSPRRIINIIAERDIRRGRNLKSASYPAGTVDKNHDRMKWDIYEIGYIKNKHYFSMYIFKMFLKFLYSKLSFLKVSRQGNSKRGGTSQTL